MSALDTEMVRLRNVTKQYRGQSVLQIDELSLNRHECVVLEGTNGSGKSTLLRLIGGIARADRGHVDRLHLLANARVGYVPQAGGLYVDLTVEDNLLLRRRLFGFSSEWPPELTECTEQLGLTKSLLKKRFNELSGGYQRLATLAAALAPRPQWLLFDEPYSGMDAEKRALAVSALTRLIGEMFLVVITSPTREDLPFTTRRIVLQDGRMV